MNCKLFLRLKTRPMFSARSARLSLWSGGAALAFLIFVRITRELIEGDVGAIDSAILLAVAKKRTPWLTIAAVDVTALGSITLVVLFSALTLLVLLVLRDRLGALQLLAASAGAGILTLVTKDIIERIRPAEAQRLIVVSGFSYPSGHSVSISALYLTIAIIAGRHVQRSAARAAMFLAVSAVIVMVGASRVYLGVHYLTDVVSGISLGAAWALLLAGFFTLVSRPERL
jgi:undecaprenyl-diphosphatase